MNLNVKNFPYLGWVMAVYLAIVSAFGVSADNVNAYEARNRAAQFLGLDKSRSSNTLTLEYSASRLDSDDAAYYIFNDDGAEAFVIVSGDDRTKSILGYSYESSFDPDNIPPALQGLLNGYRQEISSMPGDYMQPMSWSGERKSIEPLIKTKWNQSFPYDWHTPEIDGVHCAAGCVAVATAQVMYYYRGKERPTGSYSYEWRGQTLSYDYSNAKFEWDKMIEKYRGDCSPGSGSNYYRYQGEAVAELMLACGIGVDMNYSVIGGSGANPGYVKRFLVKNMGYSPEMRCISRYNWSSEEWRLLLYNELENGRPVLGDGGEHAYVCDGYDSGDYFHFNWGWGGGGDGYFTLTNMAPFTASYNIENAIIGIEPAKSENSYWVYDFTPIDFTLRKEDGSDIAVLTFNGDTEFNGKKGIKIVSQNKKIEQYFELQELEIFGPWLLILPRNMALGTGNYEIYPAYYGYGDKWRTMCSSFKQSFILLEVDDDGNCTYSNPEQRIPDYDVAITLTYGGMERLSEYGNRYSFDYIAVNRTEESCYPKLSFVCSRLDNGEIVFSITTNAKLLESSIMRGRVSGTYHLEPGRYLLDVYDDFGRKINEESCSFTVYADPTGIDSPVADTWDDRTPTEYFDLQGRRVANPGRGIYIARQGSLTRKVSLP